MKTLKVLIPVIIVFVVSFSAQAQTTYPLTVNNNTPYVSSADFAFLCGNTFVSCSPYATNSGTSCTTGTFDNVTIVITDATCTVPTDYSVTLTSANTSDTYTDCNGNPRTFDLSIGSAYDVTIN